MLKSKNSMYAVIDFTEKINNMGISSFTVFFIGGSPPEVF